MRAGHSWKACSGKSPSPRVCTRHGCYFIFAPRLGPITCFRFCRFTSPSGTLTARMGRSLDACQCCCSTVAVGQNFTQLFSSAATLGPSRSGSPSKNEERARRRDNKDGSPPKASVATSRPNPRPPSRATSVGHAALSWACAYPMTSGGERLRKRCWARTGGCAKQ